MSGFWLSLVPVVWSRPVAGGVGAGGLAGVKADSTAVRERSEPTAKRLVLDAGQAVCDQSRK
jgi:hypothetical protein